MFLKRLALETGDHHNRRDTGHLKADNNAFDKADLSRFYHGRQYLLVFARIGNRFFPFQRSRRDNDSRGARQAVVYIQLFLCVRVHFAFLSPTLMRYFAFL